jgi:hypothetical protein
MNIYFACSITGGREFESVYQAIVRTLVEDGHEVPTAHLAESGITSVEAVIDPREVYERDTAWIRACDAFVDRRGECPITWGGLRDRFCAGVGKTSTRSLPDWVQGFKDDQRELASKFDGKGLSKHCGGGRTGADIYIPKRVNNVTGNGLLSTMAKFE